SPAPATTAAPSTSGACQASVSNPSPTANSSETVHVASRVANSGVTVTVHYKTTTSTYTGQTDGSGSSDVTFRIGRATSGYTVRVDVVVGSESCSTSFTPA